MKHYETFHFEKVLWNPHARKIVLRYSLDRSISFEETLILPDEPLSEHLAAREGQINEALKALHLIGGISYYKTCLPRKISLGEMQLTKTEAKFWHSVYENGLGEFFFRNNIDFRGVVKFPSQTKKIDIEETNFLKPKHAAFPDAPHVLVPIGGGKDSVVTMELLRQTSAKITLLRIGAHPLIDALALASGLPMMTIRRSLSPALFDLNEEGALNGHVPVTAYLSILSVLIALLYDFDGIAMSNERSANEGNVQFKGMNINHQWSKSADFEKMLRRYIVDSIGSNVEYFSLLRPFSELHIAKIFATMPQYFHTVTSCNKNWSILGKDEMKIRWCGTCPKCAFVFSCLAAYLPANTLKEIFGSIYYENEALLPLYRELLGIQDFKPFECVGTANETKAAFLLVRTQRDLLNTPVMKMFEEEVLPSIKNPDALIAEALKPSTNHCIPKLFAPIVTAS